MQIEATKVKETLQKLILADGFDLVVDLEQSEGVWLQDKRNDDRYLDFYTQFASFPIGFNHPEMLSDEDFLRHLKYASLNKLSNSDFYTTEFARFVETFQQVAVPEGFKHAFFISGGALAVENALKASFDWKVRTNLANDKGEKGQQVMHFKEAFHGRTGYTLSLTNTADPRKYMYFPKFDWPRITNPKITFPMDEHLEDVQQLEQQAVAEMESAFATRKDDIAAIIIEPIQAEGGDNHFRPEFFKELRRLADEQEAMLIYDEVQTGIALTGKMWAFQHNPQYAPDMISFGKKTQVCGFMATDRIDSVPDNVFKESSRINSTWGSNLVDMVRSTKYLEIIQQHKLVEQTERVGKYMLKGLQDLAEQSDGFMSNVRGKGLFIAFDMPTTEDRNKLKKELYDNKILILQSGHKSIRVRPPLITEEEHVDQVLNTLESVLRTMNQ